MKLGIIGGCGPAAGAFFYSRLIACTAARGDGDHVDVLLTGRANTPDRTAALLGTGPSPLPALLADARWLVEGGADILALPCHTAHAFLPAIRAATHRPVLDMVSLTVQAAAATGGRRLGVLCTAGTRYAGVYEMAGARHHMAIFYPHKEVQEGLHHFIYHELKQGRGDGGAALRTACADLSGQGCEVISLSCTELSLPTAGAPARLFTWCADRGGLCPLPLIDPLDVLARHAIWQCGGKVKEEKEDAPHVAWETALRPAHSPSTGRR